MIISREVLAGMLEIPQSTTSQDDIYVELLAPAKVIRVFLSTIGLPQSLRVLPRDPKQGATMQECLDLLDFGTMYEIVGLTEALAGPLSSAAVFRGPELFAAASIRRNLDVARIAFNQLRLSDFTLEELGRFKASAE
jgi:hypothetical protein